MVCGGFTCSKGSLVGLNVLYILVSLILIIVSAYARAAAVVTSLALVGSLIACGVFLFLISLIGLVGAVKHNQVLLFFYMITLSILFLLQFSLAIACLAVNKEQEIGLVQKAWKLSDNQLKSFTQYKLECCGFQDGNLNVSDPLGHPPCGGLDCCKSPENAKHPCCSGAPSNNSSIEDCPCDTCLSKMEHQIHHAFSVTGGVGLFFSFTEILGVWISIRFRNQKDPSANPSSFL